MFNIGDWVVDAHKQVGYVEEVIKAYNQGEYTKIAYVFLPSAQKTFEKNVKDLTVLPIEFESNDFLIDLALKMKDFEWLKELTKKENVK